MRNSLLFTLSGRLSESRAQVNTFSLESHNRSTESYLVRTKYLCSASTWPPVCAEPYSAVLYGSPRACEPTNERTQPARSSNSLGSPTNKFNNGKVVFPVSAGMTFVRDGFILEKYGDSLDRTRQGEARYASKQPTAVFLERNKVPRSRVRSLSDKAKHGSPLRFGKMPLRCVHRELSFPFHGEGIVQAGIGIPNVPKSSLETRSTPE